MKGFRDRLQASPLGGVFAWFAGFYFVGTYAFALADGTSKLTLVDALVRVVSAAFFGGVMTALVAWRRRRSGGVGTLVQINRAITTGVVPEEAEPSVWVSVLQARRRQTERGRWLSPLVFGLLTLLGVWLIVQDPADAVSWIVCVFFVAVGIFSVVQTPRLLRKIDVVLAQLEAAPARSSTTAA